MASKNKRVRILKNYRGWLVYFPLGLGSLNFSRENIEMVWNRIKYYIDAYLGSDLDNVIWPIKIRDLPEIRESDNTTSWLYDEISGDINLTGTPYVATTAPQIYTDTGVTQ